MLFGSLTVYCSCLESTLVTHWQCAYGTKRCRSKHHINSPLSPNQSVLWLVGIIEWKWHSYPLPWGGISSFLYPAVPILQLYKIYNFLSMTFPQLYKILKNSGMTFHSVIKIIKFILTVLGFEITLRVLSRNKTRL